MSGELYVKTPNGTALPLSYMRSLANEAYDILSCFTDIDMSNELKRGKVEESKLVLKELRVLFEDVAGKGISPADDSALQYAYDQFGVVRKLQEDMENTLFGAPDGPGRYSPVPPFSFGDESKVDFEPINLGESAIIETRTQQVESPVNWEVDSDYQLVTPGNCDKTLPHLAPEEPN